MNIFESIVSKIFSHKAEAAAQPLMPQSPLTSPAPQGASPVNVEQILSALAQKNSQTLNWKTSIVDLLKLLGLDSSLSARKQLAKDLNYSGDMNDSARMNVWLSHEVMTKLAENGGQIPQELKH